MLDKSELKPPYEQLSSRLLNGGMKDNMDELVGYLKTIKLTPRWYATNAYNVKHKGKIIFRFTMNGNNQVALFFTVADKANLNSVLTALPENLRSYYFDHLRICTEYNPAHYGGRKFSILGKLYGCCAEPEMRIDNPVKEDIQQIIKFVSIRKENI